MSTAVEQDLRDMGFRVDRIAGADRYETAHRVARLFAPNELPTVYLASGKNYADAVAAAPNVSRETPLILTAPGSLHVQARQFLTAEDRSIGGVTILGGNAAVSETVEDEIRSLGLVTRRIAGADRYETAALIARESFGVPGCHPVRDVAVASGTSPYGGLAASAVRGPCQPLLLAPKASHDVPASLVSFGKAWRLSVGDLTNAFVTGIGSANQVPDEALAAVATGSPPEPTSEIDSHGQGGAADWEQLAASVVQVVCLNTAGVAQSWGSGFVIGDGRKVVTNHHVIVDDRSRVCVGITVRIGGSFSEAPTDSVNATLVRSSRARDLALLSLDPAASLLPAIGVSETTPRAGDEITVLGYPSVGGETMTLTTGRFSGITRNNGQDWIKTDAQIAPGNSGGGAFDVRGRLVGVPTRVEWIWVGDTSEIAGTLSLLVPARDVIALLNGTLGSRPDNASIGDGHWRRGLTTQSGDPYVAMFASADDHTLTSPWDDVEPGLFIFCNDNVVIDFWWPVAQSWGQGPFIAGQIDYRRPERNSKVPVVYRIGSPHADPTVDLWWPTDERKGIVSGETGADFVTALLNGTGPLAFGWTNFNDETAAILFPEVDGFVNAYDHLEVQCN